MAENIWIAPAAGNWNVGGNWSLGHEPAIGEPVVFTAASAHACTITANTNLIAGITCEAVITALTVNNGVALNSSAEITNNGQAVALVNNGTINGTVNWNYVISGTGTINVNTVGATLQVGGFIDSLDGQTVVITANTTLGAVFYCHKFDGDTGTLDMAGLTITVGDGGLDIETALAISNPGTFVFAESTTTAEIVTSTTEALTISVDAGITVQLSGLFYYVKSVVLNGTIDLNTKSFYIRSDIDDFWTQGAAGTVINTGGASANVTLSGSSFGATHTNSNLIDVGDQTFRLGGLSREYILKLSGGLVCGIFEINNTSGTFGIDMNGGDLTCDGILFSSGGADVTILSFGEGTHIIGANGITRDTVETLIVLNFESSIVSLGGDVTWAGMTVNLGTAVFVFSANATWEGTGAEGWSVGGRCRIRGVGHTIAVQNTDYGTVASPIRFYRCTDTAVNGDGCIFYNSERRCIVIGGGIAY